MIKHIVCFKLRDNSEAMLEETKNILLSMKDNVSLLQEIEVGVDFLHSTLYGRQQENSKNCK